MDIFAHALWTGAAAMVAKRKSGRKLRAGWTVWWGVFPDLFAFAIPVGLLWWHQLAGTQPAAVHVGVHRMPHLQVAWQLYQISHSIFVFASIFGLVWLAARRPVFELLGWPLHILIDIPTHTKRFFATPFLWPLSSYQFSGISWGNRWFMLCNYSALAVVYFLLWRTRRRAGAAKQAEESSGELEGAV
jgi:hypothetical protein